MKEILIVLKCFLSLSVGQSKWFVTHCKWF